MGCAQGARQRAVPIRAGYGWWGRPAAPPSFSSQETHQLLPSSAAPGWEPTRNRVGWSHSVHQSWVSFSLHFFHQRLFFFFLLSLRENASSRLKVIPKISTKVRLLWNGGKGDICGLFNRASFSSEADDVTSPCRHMVTVPPRAAFLLMRQRPWQSISVSPWWLERHCSFVFPCESPKVTFKACI